jgi:endo-1,4-beta-D-glucanase Y
VDPRRGTLSAYGAPQPSGLTSRTPPAAYANLFVTLSGHTQAQSDAKLSAAWSQLFNPAGSGTIYFNGPGSDESYVEDLYNGDVRTEGMSHGMMIAVQLDHQTEFDRIWTWVKKHMANGTGPISWSCSTSGNKNSSGGAPDGEEYMATASSLPTTAGATPGSSTTRPRPSGCST